MNLRRLAFPALFALLFATGCASPATMSGVGTRIFAAIPGLSYVNGDVDEGTTTLASLPLLSYRSTEEHPGYFDSETWIVPLLGRFAQTDRYVRLTWEGKGEEADKAQGPPPDWWDRERKRYGEKPRKRRKRKRTREVPPEEGESSPGDSRRRSKKSRKKKKDEKRKGKKKEKREAPKGSAAASGDKAHLVLRVDRPGKIIKQLPQQKTQWDLFFGLIGHHAERPARVMFRPKRTGARKGKKRKKKRRKRKKGDVVYEIGPTSDSFRLLPLFSFRRSPEGAQFMFWPLLMGWEREGKERYMRLFYFLKVPLK